MVRKVVKWLDEYLEEFLLVCFLGCMTVIMGIQVFSRYALGASLSWSEEITRYLFIWSGFTSISFCIKKCLSIRIEQFITIFPKKGQSLLQILTYTIELVVFLYLIPFAFAYLRSAVESGQVSPACQIPMYYIQAAPLISFILVVLRIIQKWFEEFQAIRNQGGEK